MAARSKGRNHLRILYVASRLIPIEDEHLFVLVVGHKNQTPPGSVGICCATPKSMASIVSIMMPSRARMDAYMQILCKKTNAKTILLLLLVGGVWGGCANGESEGADQAILPFDAETLVRFRADKDGFLREDPDSPLPDSVREDFSGLQYFEPDSSYAVRAHFEPFPEPISLKMMTTTGEPRDMLRVGLLRFELNGTDLRLIAYKNSAAATHYFVPFLDSTSGGTTYSAGRYLDVPVQEGEDLLLDFNYAYSPYCAYNDAYSCPIVPRENMLETAVRAGELTYEKSVP